MKVNLMILNKQKHILYVTLLTVPGYKNSKENANLHKSSPPYPKEIQPKFPLFGAKCTDPPPPPSAGATPTASPKTHESGKSEEGRPRELAQEWRSRRVV